MQQQTSHTKLTEGGSNRHNVVVASDDDVSSLVVAVSWSFSNVFNFTVESFSGKSWSVDSC